MNVLVNQKSPLFKSGDPTDATVGDCGFAVCSHGDATGDYVLPVGRRTGVRPLHTPGAVISHHDRKYVVGKNGAYRRIGKEPSA